MNGKSIFKSKTVWFNALSLLVAVASAFGFAEFTPDPAVNQLAGTIVSIVTSANIVLRIVTKEPVRLP